MLTLALPALAQDNLPLESEPASPSPFSTPGKDILPIPDEEASPPAVLPLLEDPPPPVPAAADPLELRQRLMVDPEPDFDTYRLGPGDGIFVGVQRFPDLSFQATLDLQGNVVVPLAGAINLEGLTLDEARQAVFEIYNRYVVNPDVSLTLTAQRPVQVTIVGEVTRPGFYPLPAPQLSTALLTAGGTTSHADLRQVHIQRKLSQEQSLEQTVDLFTPLYQGESIPNVRLQDGDVIRVARLDPTRLDEYNRTLVANSTLAKPEITVRILNYASGARGIEARFGALNLRNGSRFLDALALAGVNPDLAAYNRIAVLRFNPEKGEADTIMVNAAAAVNGDLSQNIPLQENDVIVVDRNLLARVTYALNTFTQPFRDVLGFLLFFESLSDAAESLFGP
jgi:polysaccharide export outer membrane protein